MRLIDADALRAQVEAAKYPLKTEMLSMVDAAPTVNVWRDVKNDPPKKAGLYLTYVVRNGVAYSGLCWYTNKEWINDLNIVTKDLKYWAELPNPPKEKQDAETD